MVAALVATSIAALPAAASAQTPPVPAPPAAPSAPVSSAGPSAPAPPSAATESAAGDKAAKAKDYAGALPHYQASVQAAPSAHAQLGVADALYQLGRAADAYTAYADAQQIYGTKLAGADKATVAARLKELAGKTGSPAIHVDESGADVALDGKSVGTSPMAALLRVATGPHEVRVNKTGYLPFVGQADVPPDGKAVVDSIPLVMQPTHGHVIVHAPGTEALRVIIDGIDLGATPWEGDLPAGTHEIAGRSSTQTASAQTVTLAVGDKVTLDLVAAATAAHLQVRTNDGKGSVFVDAVNKGQGGFAGDVSPGAHTIVVEAPGFERYEKTVTLGERETWAEIVALKPAQAAAAVASAPDRAFEGIYGGFGLAGLFGVGGQGTDLDTNCDGLGASSCDTGQPAGGAAFGYVGWTWDPVGFELMLAGSVDTLAETAHFGTGANAGSPLATPPRNESFRFLRAGGLVALRARASFQGRWLRGTIAGGLGLSYKQMFMERDAVTTDGTDRRDVFVPKDNVAYVSPAISVEGALHFRLTPTVAIAVGLEMWADNASIWGNNATNAAPGRLVGSATSTTPPEAIATPSYHLASGPQVFLAPFLGMQFGP